MADITLDDLFELGKKTVIKEFYLPIDESVAGFNNDWLRNIVLAEGNREQKIKNIKSHPYIKSGNIISAEFDKLGLQFLFYADVDKKPLKDLRELVFYAVSPSKTLHKRLNELDSDFMIDFDQCLRYREHETGYMPQAIDPRVAGIKQIGKFNVDSFGSKYPNSPQRMSATKTFESQNGTADLKYSASLNSEGVVDEFNISLEISSGTPGPSDFLGRIDVKNVDGKYVPRAEVRVKSATAKHLGSSSGLVSYHFDPDGQFDYIKLLNSEIVLDREQIKAMEGIYANLEGVVWYDGKYCLKITTDNVKNSNINALLTGENIEHHAISAMTKSDSALGKDYKLVPVANLGAAPGLTSDLLKIQYYRQFTNEFGKVGIFNSNPEKVAINYVDAIMTLANIQNKPAYDVLLLS